VIGQPFGHATDVAGMGRVGAQAGDTQHFVQFLAELFAVGAGVVAGSITHLGHVSVYSFRLLDVVRVNAMFDRQDQRGGFSRLLQPTLGRIRRPAGAYRPILFK